MIDGDCTIAIHFADEANTYEALNIETGECTYGPTIAVALRAMADLFEAREAEEEAMRAKRDTST